MHPQLLEYLPWADWACAQLLCVLFASNGACAGRQSSGEGHYNKHPIYHLKNFTGGRSEILYVDLAWLVQCCLQDWSYQEGAKLRQLLANLQRVTRRTVHAKCLTAYTILNRSFYARLVINLFTIQSLSPSQVEEDADLEEAVCYQDGLAE